MKNDEFTCQREGLYKIHVYVMPKNSVDVTNLVLYKSGEQVVRVSISDRNVVGTTTVLELHIGDTVYGQLVSGHNFDSSAYGHMRDMVTILTAIYIADLNEGMTSC